MHREVISYAIKKSCISILTIETQEQIRCAVPLYFTPGGALLFSGNGGVPALLTQRIFPSWAGCSEASSAVPRVRLAPADGSLLPVSSLLFLFLAFTCNSFQLSQNNLAYSFRDVKPPSRFTSTAAFHFTITAISGFPLYTSCISRCSIALNSHKQIAIPIPMDR